MRNAFKLIVLVSFLAFSLSVPKLAFAKASEIIFYEETSGTIYRAKPDGTGITSIITLASGDSSLAVDSKTGKIYVANQIAGTISELDSSKGTLKGVVTGATSPINLAIDSTNRYFYWVTNGTPYTIQRVSITNPNSGIETIVDSTIVGSYPGNLVVDGPGGSIYWTDRFNGTIWTAMLNGGSRQQLTQQLDPLLSCLGIDTKSKKLYWCEFSNGRLSRSNLDGSGYEIITSEIVDPESVAIDQDDGPTLYIGSATQGLYRYDLKLSSLEQTISNGGSTYHVSSIVFPLNSTLVPGFELVDAPDISVNDSTRTVTFTMQDFGELSNSLGELIKVKASSKQSARWDVTVIENDIESSASNSTNRKYRKVSRSNKASLKLPPGNYSARYKVKLVERRPASKRAEVRDKVVRRIGQLKQQKSQSPPSKRTVIQNKIAAETIRKQLSGYRLVGSSTASPSSPPFSIK